MKRLEQMNILLVGNNPTELSIVNQSAVSFRKTVLKATVLFDFKKLSQSIKNLNPSGIFIDDKLNLKEIKRVISKLHNSKNTSHIPVTIIKSSNYTNYPNLGADDFILHTNLNGSSIYNSVVNGRQFRKSRIYVIKAYRKQKGRFFEIREKADTFFSNF